jgi:hypothetical protein
MRQTFLTAMFTTILTLSTIGLNAQISYEHSYPVVSPRYGWFFITDLGYDNYKYVLHDYYLDRVSLYNLDHSLFMDIQIPISSDTGLRYSIGYITSALFDCDSSTIEYALLPENAIYPFKVYRTDGTELFSKDSVYGWWCYGCQEASTEIRTIVNTPSGTKLYLQYPWSDPDSVLVYSLCGSLPLIIDDRAMTASFVKVFPNPTGGLINFQIHPPNNQDKFRLTIYNSAFQIVDEKNNTDSNYQLDLSSRSLSSGTYLYDLRTDSKVFQTGKFVITR